MQLFAPSIGVKLHYFSFGVEIIASGKAATLDKRQGSDVPLTIFQIFKPLILCHVNLCDHVSLPLIAKPGTPKVLTFFLRSSKKKKIVGVPSGGANLRFRVQLWIPKMKIWSLLTPQSRS